MSDDGKRQVVLFENGVRMEFRGDRRVEAPTGAFGRFAPRSGAEGGSPLSFIPVGNAKRNQRA